jgi:hypothetical protein
MTNDDDTKRRTRAAWNRIRTLVQHLPPCEGVVLRQGDGDDATAHVWGTLENGTLFSYCKSRPAIEFGSELPIEALVGVLEEVYGLVTNLLETQVVGYAVQGSRVEFRLPTQPAAHRTAVFSETTTSRDTQRAALLMALTFLVTGILETHREMESQSEYFGQRQDRLERLNAGIAMVETIQEVLKIPKEERLELGTNLVDYGIKLATWAMRR